MKKIIVLAAFVLTGVAIQAQTPTQEPAKTENPSPAAKSDDADKVQIKAEELPMAVKKTLEDQEYKGWLINSAYHDKKNGQYEVELKNGADTQKIRFSHEGQRLDD
jgi:hypothetical protein